MNSPLRKPPFQFGLASLFWLTAAAIPFLCCFGLPYWVMEMPAVPESKLVQMRAGMSRDEVRQLLGRPRYDQGSHWVYDRMTWAHLTIIFDADGKVRDFDHDF